MELILILIAALSPAVLLLWYIKRKDSLQPEPTGWLIKAFCYGMGSAVMAIIFGMFVDDVEATDMVTAFETSFYGAAIPEELAKLLMLWLLLRKNPYFDEKFDGIVYAGCIGLGFAGLENVFYLFDTDDWISTGISRALFSVPGHFLFGVLMGYYYSIYHFGVRRNMITRCLIFIAPVTAHTVYDWLLFWSDASEEMGALLMVIFFIFFYFLRKTGASRINELKDQ